MYNITVSCPRSIGKWTVTDALSVQTDTIDADCLGQRVLRTKERPSRFPGTDEEFYPWDV